MKSFYKVLDWDSNFFGFSVARIKEDILGPDQGEGTRYLEEMSANGVVLAYYSSSSALNLPLQNSYDVQYIVKRFPLIKMNIKKTPKHPKISLYDKDFPEEELIQLGQLAGRQGRFGRDGHISTEQCDEIFKNWVINSVKKEMATHVLVYREKQKIVGFCTIDIRGNVGYSPLFAVERNHEGKGVSFALMRAAENVFIDNGCDRAAGGTQELNKKALKVYERFGLVPQEPEYIYHLWNKEFLKKQQLKK